MSRSCLLIFLFAILFGSAAAQDYNHPRGVQIFSEAELFNQFVGNSVSNRNYVEYYVPPSPGQKRGLLRGKSEVYGYYDGDWQIEGELICIRYYLRLMSALGNCYTAARAGEEVRIYRRDGYELYPDGGRLIPISGNPQDL